MCWVPLTTRALRAAETNATMPSTAEQHMKLADMKEKGLLDSGEFKAEKAKVLAGNGVATGVPVESNSGGGDAEAMRRKSECEARDRKETREREEKQEREDKRMNKNR